MATNFYFEQPITLRQRIRLKSFIERIFKKEKKPVASLTYVFCSDEYLLQINSEYLKHDYYTDIITFNLGELKRSPAIGEIYISVDRVKDNAKILSVPVNHELHRVMFHGALHLCGYKDKNKSQKQEMRNREDYYLKKYFKGST